MLANYQLGIPNPFLKFVEIHEGAVY